MHTDAGTRCTESPSPSGRQGLPPWLSARPDRSSPVGSSTLSPSWPTPRSTSAAVMLRCWAGCSGTSVAAVATLPASSDSVSTSGLPCSPDTHTDTGTCSSAAGAVVSSGAIVILACGDVKLGMLVRSRECWQASIRHQRHRPPCSTHLAHCSAGQGIPAASQLRLQCVVSRLPQQRAHLQAASSLGGMRKAASSRAAQLRLIAQHTCTSACCSTPHAPGRRDRRQAPTNGFTGHHHLHSLEVDLARAKHQQHALRRVGGVDAPAL